MAWFLHTQDAAWVFRATVHRHAEFPRAEHGGFEQKPTVPVPTNEPEPGDPGRRAGGLQWVQHPPLQTQKSSFVFSRSPIRVDPRS